MIGAINTGTGSYDGSYYFMAGCGTVAALLVALFPTRWSHVPALRHGDRRKGAAADPEAAEAAAWQAAAAQAAAAEAGAAGEHEAARQRMRRRRRTLTESFLRAMAEGGNGECQLACPEPIRWACAAAWGDAALLAGDRAAGLLLCCCICRANPSSALDWALNSTRLTGPC